MNVKFTVLRENECLVANTIFCNSTRSTSAWDTAGSLQACQFCVSVKVLDFKS